MVIVVSGELWTTVGTHRRGTRQSGVGEGTRNVFREKNCEARFMTLLLLSRGGANRRAFKAGK